MSNVRPLLYLFQTYDHNYMYDTNKNQVLRLSNHNYQIISECMAQKNFYEAVGQVEDIFFKDFYHKAQKVGFFNSKRISKIENPMTRLLPQVLQAGISDMALQVTQSCNLRCGYCPYSGNFYVNREHSAKRMSWETAKKAIDYYIAHSSAQKKMALGFYGGEPLLEFPLIKKCISYISERVLNRQIIFNLTTNATLLNDEIMNFFSQNQVRILVSLDGPEEIHDRFRKFADGSGSFSTVVANLKRFKLLFPEYFNEYVQFNSVVNMDQNLSCIDQFFSSESAVADAFVQASWVSNASLQDGVVLPVNDIFKTTLVFENLKVILNRLGLYNPIDSERPSVFTVEYSYVKDLNKHLSCNTCELSDVMHPGGPCIPGLKKLFISADGIIYPCERVNEKSVEMQIGTLDEGLNIDRIAEIINIGKLTEHACRNCWAVLYCTLCAAFSSDEAGTQSSKIRLQFCNTSRKRLEGMLRELCMYKEFGYDFDIEKSYYFQQEDLTNGEADISLSRNES